MSWRRSTRRLTPQQTRLESSIVIDPVSWNHRYVVYWGTGVRVFEANTAHRAPAAACARTSPTLLVGALWHVGVPARYVSGYLYPSKQPQIGDGAEGESHAWVEWWLGDRGALGPTNLCDVAERHVMFGTGGADGGVPPIKGIVAGAHNTLSPDVRVEFTRLA